MAAAVPAAAPAAAGPSAYRMLLQEASLLLTSSAGRYNFCLCCATWIQDGHENKKHWHRKASWDSDKDEYNLVYWGIWSISKLSGSPAEQEAGWASLQFVCDTEPAGTQMFALAMGRYLRENPPPAVPLPAPQYPPPPPGLPNSGVNDQLADLTLANQLLVERVSALEEAVRLLQLQPCAY